MGNIDVSLCMADFTPGFWDNYWINPMGKSSKDPDRDCLLLLEYHRKLWSKELPNGRFLNLKKVDSSSYLTWNSFRFSSDSIIVSFRYEKYIDMINEVAKSVANYKEYIENYVKIAYTIGGFTIFPRMMGGINQARGCNTYIRDRFDLTLECIRRYYSKEASPLSEVMNKNKDFLDLFVSFKGYVEFFYFQDLVSDDFTKVNFWLESGDLSQSPFPTTVDEYLTLIKKQINFVQKRNERIMKDLNIN